MSENEAAQEDELLALESIFDNDDGVVNFEATEDNGKVIKSGSLKISPDVVDPPIQFSSRYVKRNDGQYTESYTNTSRDIAYLPPICLNFVLPVDYPSQSPPYYTLTCVWLSREKLSSIASKLDCMWKEQEGQEVLYTWAQFLKEELLEHLNIHDEVKVDQEEFIKAQGESLDERVVQSVARFADIFPLVTEYDELKQKKVFDNTPFQCNVCFTEKYGRNCLQFKGCNHVYCETCMKSFFSVQIKEGNMRALTCPDPGCDSQASPAQIKSLVSKKDFERYETILLQTTLDTMTDVTYCPRTFCQSAVVIEPGETMGMCTVCQYSFCTFCKLAFHGIEPCKLKKSALKEVVNKYIEGDSKTKRDLELKYGAKILRKTVENIESERWIASNSKNCPGCSSAIEKKDGCNKMTCYKCKCYFCWLCMQRLNLSNPYSHYNTFGSKCYNQLFQGVVLDDDEFLGDDEFLEDDEFVFF